jgi:hypothetical protein
MLLCWFADFSLLVFFALKSDLTAFAQSEFIHREKSSRRVGCFGRLASKFEKELI